MSQDSSLSFLEKEVGLLVEHFGLDRVRTALKKFSKGVVKPLQSNADRRSVPASRVISPSINSTLEQIRTVDAERYSQLAEFYLRLKDGDVLPESQDIRHFAQLIGLKEIGGKSRKGLIPRLMRFLADQPLDQLQAAIEAASLVSEQQRRQGFSVLADKLMGDHKS